MTDSSLNRTDAFKAFGAPLVTVIRAVAVLSVLLLAALVEVAAQTYVDPEFQFSAAATWLVGP
jgi:hypothetical protein